MICFHYLKPYCKSQWGKKFLSWWLWILFFGLPLVSYPQTPQGYEIAKFIFWEVWWLGYLVWLVLNGVWKNLWQERSIPVILGWIFILIMGITAFQGGSMSFLGSIFRQQGWLFFFQLWIFFLGLRGKKYIFTPTIAGLGLSTIILVLMGIGNRFIGWARVGGSFGEPNAFAGYLVIVFPLLLNKTWGWSAVSAVFGVYLTESRSAVAALGIGSFVFLIGLIRSLKIKTIDNAIKIVLPKRHTRSVAKRLSWCGGIKSAFLGGIILGSLFLIWNWRDLRISSEDSRFGVWKMAIRAGLARPLTGYGADNINGVLVQFAAEKEIGMKGLVIDRTHSLFLDLWLWSGVLGMMSFFTWLIGTLWSYLKQDEKDWRLISSVVGFLVFSSLNPVPIPIWVILFFILGMMEGKRLMV